MLVRKSASPVKPARVVVLGAGGFLAPELVCSLSQDGIPVRAIGSTEVDLTSDAAAEKLAAEFRPDDAIVMVAGLTPDKGRDTRALMKNLRMAETVCAALERVKPAHFLYVSSDGVYDGRFSSLLDEESPCGADDLYCVMHIAREKMLGQTCRALLLPLAILRPCAIYGPADTHNSYGPNRFIRSAHQSGKITLFGGGEEKRHHVYVTDVAEIIKLCILHGSTGVINAVTGDSVSFCEIAERIAAATGIKVTIERLPRSAPIVHRNFDISALVRAFPYLRVTPLDLGLSWTMEGMFPRR
jgi:UDP-glucose 4-epimerase